MPRATGRRRRSANAEQASPRRIGRAVRKAALGSYGVAAVTGPRWYDRPLGWLGLATPGVRVESDDGLRVEVNLEVAKGVPAAAVASNVSKAVRYVVQRDLGRTIDELVVLEEGRPLATAPAAVAHGAGSTVSRQRKGRRKG